MKLRNKNATAVHLALAYVGEHKEDFEKWVKEKANKGYISHLDKVMLGKEETLNDVSRKGE